MTAPAEIGRKNHQKTLMMSITRKKNQMCVVKRSVEIVKIVVGKNVTVTKIEIIIETREMATETRTRAYLTGVSLQLIGKNMTTEVIAKEDINLEKMGDKDHQDIVSLIKIIFIDLDFTDENRISNY